VRPLRRKEGIVTLKALAISQFETFVKHQAVRYKSARVPWISLPTHRGFGFESILSYEDGATLYGEFVLLAATAANMERRGVFARHGQPLDLPMIARFARVSQARIESSVQRLELAGWLEYVEITSEGVSEITSEVVSEDTSEGVTGRRDGTGRDETGRDETTTSRSSRRFKPPTEDEVRSYLVEIGKPGAISPEAFVAFYGSKGWVVGKSPMKNWKLAVRTWLVNRAATAASSPDAGRYADVTLTPLVVD